MGENSLKQANLTKLRNSRTKFFEEHWHYKRYYFERAPYDVLKNIMYLYKPGKAREGETKKSYNEVVIMFDTETSKKRANLTKELKSKPGQNHVCAWTISVRSYGVNIFTVWGRKPSDLVKTIKKIHEHLPGDITFYYAHNLPYDWFFERKFCIKEWGNPIKQLNVKEYYPIYIEFANGIVFRDSLILSQCRLEKWAEDLDVEHKKAVGDFDYNVYRNQSYPYSRRELGYMEHDTLAGVECIDKYRLALGKHLYNMPWTATGIVRESCRVAGRPNKAHETFLKLVGDYDLQLILEQIFHGGYTHGNRHFYGMIIRTCEGWGDITAYDFASSYTATALLEKFPMEKFSKIEGTYTIDEILENSDDTAFLCKLTLVRPELITDKLPMPYLQYSKCFDVMNPVLDNGRLVQCDACSILVNEIDLQILASQYKYMYAACTDVYRAHKDYLPRWYTDFGYNLFKEKTKLKGGDKVLYMISKAKLNAGSYGMTVQKPCKDDIIEEYTYNENELLYHNQRFVHEDGTEYTDEEIYNFRKSKYEEYTQKRNSILLYQWGIYITSFAARNLFRLGACIDYKNGGQWLYSDTDSIYCTKMDPDKLKAYNDDVIRRLEERGYLGIEHKGRLYYPGIAEHNPEEDLYKEFVYMGAKRYAGRHTLDNELVTTVAGVPKKTGKKCLKDDIENFKQGFIFSGVITGKKTHTHFVVPEIYIDEDGNETGDSIDLTPCDYLLDKTDYEGFDPFEDFEEVNIQSYEDD